MGRKAPHERRFSLTRDRGFGALRKWLARQSCQHENDAPKGFPGKSVAPRKIRALTSRRMAAARTTQDDVARAAGVHRTTVSLALKHHPRIPGETQERVRRIADELG